MEDSWHLSTPISLNANMPTLEMKGLKTRRELYIAIDEMTKTLDHFGKKIEQQNKDSSSRIRQLKACLTAMSSNIIFTKQSMHIPKKKK